MTPSMQPQRPTDALRRMLAGEALADIHEVPQEHLEAIYAEACDQVQREDFERALDLLLFLIVHDPYDFRFQFGYGLCLQQLGQLADAAKHYGLAWVLDPSDAGCAYRLGECHEALGDRDSAVEAYRTAIQLCVPADLTANVRALAEIALDRLHA